MIKYFFTKLFKFISKPKKITSNKNIVSGVNSLYNGKMSVSGHEKVVFGNYCAIGPNLNIITSNHNYNLPSIQMNLYKKLLKVNYQRGASKGSVIIGNDVWFGSNVTVLSGVKIGDGACIGAGSVVTKNIPPYSIAAGVPAKVIKRRFNEDVVKYLLDIEWWNWSEEKIKNNKNFFLTDFNSIGVKELSKIKIYK